MVYDAQLRKQFKRSARRSIAQAFWPAMMATVLALLPAGLISIIYNQGVKRANPPELALIFLVYLAAMLLVATPLQFGSMHYYTARARGEIVPISTLFVCFSDMTQYKNSIKLCLATLVRSIGWVLLEIAAMIPMCAVLVYSMVAETRLGVVMMYAFLDEGRMPNFLPEPDVTEVGVLLGSLLLVVVVSMVVSVKLRRYDAAAIRLIDDPSMSAWEATGECAVTFRRHNWELFVFDLSFILWDLLTIITVGIAGIYVQTYQTMAYINYFDALRQHELGIPPVSLEG